MIIDDRYPWAIVLGPNDEETGVIEPWDSEHAWEITLKAYQVNGYALQINGDNETLCDFRRLPGRMWMSRHGQEIRVFKSDPGVWQYSFSGMDVTNGAYYSTEDEAREDAELVDKHTPAPWYEGDYPLWADLFAWKEETE